MNRFLNIKVSKDFWVAELMPPETFDMKPEDFYRLITPYMRILPQKLRDIFGKPILMNTWWEDPQNGNKYRGWRPQNCKVGAAKSSHKYGMAIDIEIPGLHPKEVFDFISKHADEFPEITAYEKLASTPTWNHLDGRFTGQKSWLEL